MQKTRKEALDEFLGYVNERGDDLARDLAEAALNRAVEAIWQAHHWRDFQSPDPCELTLVAGQNSYPLPDYFGRLGIGRVRNLTRGTEILPLDLDQADQFYPKRGSSLEQASCPKHYVLGGIVGVRRQPAVAGEALEVVFSSPLDTDDLRVSLVGNDASGNQRRLQLTPNGTTAVAAGTWSYVDEFGKGYRAGVEPVTEGTSSEGTATLRIVSSVTTLQELFREESAREHRVITFLPKPNAGDTIAIPVMRRPPRLLFDGDPLPADWWNAIFEELKIDWRDGNGDLSDASQVPRPHLVRLVALDNNNKPRPTIRPYGSR